MRHDFNSPKETNNSFYDIKDDYTLIEASFLQEYGIRLRNTNDMPWDEFCTYLIGLGPKTPLGQIVSIRAETDKEVIKKMTPEQRRIRYEWNMKMVKEMKQDDRTYNDMKKMVSNLADGLSQI